MKNEIYAECKKYIKQNHGYSGEELRKTELYRKYLAFMESLKQYHRKKIILKYSQQNDWTKHQGEKRGRIIVNQEGRICFFEGRCTRRGYYLDAGLYDGWFATLIPLEITEIK